MKYIYFVIVLILSFCNAHAQIQEKFNLQYKNAAYDIFVLRVDSSLTSRFQILDNTNLLPESIYFDSLQQKGLFFAVNAGIVDSVCNLLGLQISKGIKIQDVNTHSGFGNFYLMPNGFFALGENDVLIKKTDEYNVFNNYSCATQSGPMLIVDSSINKQFDMNSKNKNIRVGVGIFINASGKFLVFAISNTAVTFHQFASLFLEKYKCSNALNLESGPYCSMRLPSSKKTSSITKKVCKYLYFQIK